MTLKYIALLVLGAAAGWPFGAPVAGVAVVAIGALVHQLYNLSRLKRMLRADDTHDPHPPIGDWSDVQRRLRAQIEATHENRRINRQLIDLWDGLTAALPGAAVLLGENFDIVQFNDQARTLLHIDKDADPGRPITHLIRHPDFVSMIEKRRFADPIRFVDPRQPERTLSGRITTFDNGQHLFVVSDVTEQLRTGKVKTDFVANASHELRTPLTVLKGYLLGMADDAALADDWHEPVSEMNLHVDRMQALVADLLQLNQFEAEVDAPMTNVDIVGILRRSCKEAGLLSENAAMIQCDCVSTKQLLGDESALRSIVTNLLTNAVRFTPADGLINTTWLVDETGGRLSVADNGIGIDADDIDRVTERFYRTDPGRARHQGGTGLGLAIVKHALAMHRGRLSIDSEPGRGSVFTCHFPPERIGESK